MTKRVSLCADDYGLNSSVNRAIVALCDANRLSAVSCMAPFLTKRDGTHLSAERTGPDGRRVEIGLHITLTEVTLPSHSGSFSQSGQLPSINALLLRSHLGLIDKNTIAAEIRWQWNRFCDVFGRLPDFVDGHQHVHLMPGVREAVVDCVREHKNEVWVRNCTLPTPYRSGFKARLIHEIASRAKRTFEAAGLSINDQFLGVNDFNRSENFRALFKDWLTSSARYEGHTVIMCHPGFESPDNARENEDILARRRMDEYDYLASFAFLEDWAAAGLPAPATLSA